MRKIKRVGASDSDPLQGVANLFDLGIVFSLAFLLAVMVRMGQSPVPINQKSDSSSSKGQKVSENRKKTEKFKESKDSLSGEGERLGTAYRLESGEIIYVPD